jgi:Tfp pilus assembly protein PilO
VKKKLAALDVRIQVGAVGFLLLLVAVAGYMFVVSPQGAQAAKIQKQIDATQTQIYQRRAELKKGEHPPEIKVADIFKLARAMPDREDMPGIILTLSQVARAAGIRFDLIEPSVGTAPLPTGNYQVERIHLLFNGDFYGLSDFLYRLRSLVSVRNGTLDAGGRLFNVDTVTFDVAASKFPQISAELFVDAYVYGGSAPATATSTTTTPPTTTPATTPSSTDSTSTDSTTSTEGATAAAATP